MTQGVSPNDIYHNGAWYSRSGGGGPATYVMSADGVTPVGIVGANINFAGFTQGTEITASKNSALGDLGKIIFANHAATPIVVTILNDATVVWPDNATLALYMKGAAQVSFAAGGSVTLHNPGSITCSQFGMISAVRVGVNEWTVV
jgi:hypothetical protein